MKNAPLLVTTRVGPWNVPSPFPSSTAKLPLASTIARSRWPSRLKSPVTKEENPVLAMCVSVPNVPSPFPSSIPIPELSARRRSALPSPLKSATATARGLVPAETFAADFRVPSPLPSRMLSPPLSPTEASPEFTTAMSSLPSPLKSPTAAADGLVPTA